VILSTVIGYFFVHPSFDAGIEEGRAASKSPHQKFGYFLSISQPAVSADIFKIQLCRHPRKGCPSTAYDQLYATTAVQTGFNLFDISLVRL
jgi:hypothetical protein